MSSFQQLPDCFLVRQIFMEPVFNRITDNRSCNLILDTYECSLKMDLALCQNRFRRNRMCYAATCKFQIVKRLPTYTALAYRERLKFRYSRYLNQQFEKERSDDSNKHGDKKGQSPEIEKFKFHSLKNRKCFKTFIKRHQTVRYFICTSSLKLLRPKAVTN